MIFDIETIPDVDSGRKLLHLPDTLSDQAVGEALFQRQLAKTQQASSFLPHYLQRVVAISVVVSTRDWVKVWSLGDVDSDEATLLERFFSGVERYTPTLVSWNGGGFDLPVLHYRALLHGVSAGRYWEAGLTDPQFKWNNYLSRYHARHLDLMDILSGYQPRATAPLSELAVMLGFPGKMGEQGDQVWEKFLAGNVQGIRDYCETDVVNTYGVYLAFQKMRGLLTAEEIAAEKKRLSDYLITVQKPHWAPFLEVLK